MTYDIDLMILSDPKDLATDTKRNSWVREKGMKALNFYSETLPIGEIDIVMDSPIPYKELKRRAIKIKLQDEKIPTVSIHDLIYLTTVSREQIANK